MDAKTAPLYEVAAAIERDLRSQGKPVPPAAKPYLNGMRSLTTMDDKYIVEDAETIVRYALSNLSAWRGDNARRIKKELNERLKGR
jgi:hypothetical protein